MSWIWVYRPGEGRTTKIKELGLFSLEGRTSCFFVWLQKTPNDCHLLRGFGNQVLFLINWIVCNILQVLSVSTIYHTNMFTKSLKSNRVDCFANSKWFTEKAYKICYVASLTSFWAGTGLLGAAFALANIKNMLRWRLSNSPSTELILRGLTWNFFDCLGYYVPFSED